MIRSVLMLAFLGSPVSVSAQTPPSPPSPLAFEVASIKADPKQGRGAPGRIVGSEISLPFCACWPAALHRRLRRGQFAFNHEEHEMAEDT